MAGLLDYGIMQPGPTMAADRERRKSVGSRGLLEAIGAPMSFAPNPVVNAIGQGLLGARYLTGEADPTEGAKSLSDMTAMAVGSRLPAPLRNIVRPDVAKQLGYKANLPASEEFAQSVANTPGASVTADGLLMRVQRNQLPEQGLQPSVRGGVFYLPEGAAQAKHYSTGKSGYGGSEKITGETLLVNPLFAKGGTGGRAPASAYDQLQGKGAYDAMRTDALKAFGGWDAKTSDKAALADEFLDKYAPELSGMGDYIVRNSGKGNQLAYALQEAAVGSAVRRSGHDSVLGYSKGKAGNFLSELFDVRESVYPDKFGGFGLHDDLHVPR